jgi:branched-chain amino acid transport system substrate-binding protein
MGRYAAGTLHVKRVAAINEWDVDGAPIIDSFATELTRYGGQLVLSQDLNPGTNDFTKFLAAAKAQNADAVYAVGDVDHFICLARAQMTEPIYFLGTDGMARTTECLDQSGQNADGIIATFPDVDPTQSKDPAAMRVVDSYRRTYNTKTIADFTFAAYDCALMLIDAIRRAIKANGGTIPSRRQVLDAVADTKEFKGVTGLYSFDSNGDAIGPLMSLYKVHVRDWIGLGKIDASSKRG